jgi:ribosomal protein S18 acetylase RimI-like enzyme
MLTIKKTTPEDVLGINKVLKAAWLATYPNEEHGVTKEAIEAKFAGEMPEDDLLECQERYRNPKPGELYLTAKEDENIIGFIGVTRNEDGTGEVNGIYVHPAFHGKGIGRDLMMSGLGWLKACSKIIIHCASYNTKALKFYRKFGFEVDESVVVEIKQRVSGLMIPEVELVKFNKI